MSDDLRKHNAAIKIQSTFRGFSFRRNSILESYRQVSAIKIQSFWRKCLSIQKYRKIKEKLALKILERNFISFLRKLHSRELMKSYDEYRKILQFYPGQSKEPVTPKKTVRVFTRTSRPKTALVTKKEKQVSAKQQIARPKTSIDSRVSNTMQIATNSKTGSFSSKLSRRNSTKNDNEKIEAELQVLTASRVNTAFFSNSSRSIKKIKNSSSSTNLSKVTLPISKNETTLISKNSNIKSNSNNNESNSHLNSTNFKLVPPVIGNYHPKKRKQLVDLGPPWHGRDERHFSPVQKEQMMFEQKNTIAWVKQEIIPNLLRKADSAIQMVDDLIIRNEIYMYRQVLKPNICTWARNTSNLMIANPIALKILNDEGFLGVASFKKTAHLYLNGFSDEYLIAKDNINIGIPLFDIAIHPQSGEIYGLDINWRLHHLIYGLSNTSIDLSQYLQNKLPTIKYLIFFDKFGLLWINFLPQHGDLICVDPLTLEPSIIISFDALVSRYNYNDIISFKSLIPLAYNQTPLGFAVVFSKSTDVSLFSYDFNNLTLLRHGKFKEIPHIKVSGNHLFVWSNDQILYIYEIKATLPSTKLIGYFSTPAKIIDVSITGGPPLIYVACTDLTIHIYLSKSISYPKNIIGSKLSFQELAVAHRLFGEIQMTQSFRQFNEVTFINITSSVVSIESLSVSENLSLLFVLTYAGAVASFWIFNDAQSVSCSKFDENISSKPVLLKQKSSKIVTQSARKQMKSSSNHVTIMINENENKKNIFATAPAEIHSRIFAAFQKSYIPPSYQQPEIINSLQLYHNFDETAITSMIQNTFATNQTPINIIQNIRPIRIHTFYSFLPSLPNSSYELFHFLLRSRILPDKFSRFSSFLKRFVPADKIRSVGKPEMVFNPMLPVYTKGLYLSLSQIFFTPEDIQSILSQLNPVSNLKQLLRRFTLSNLNSKQSDDVIISTQKQWFLTLKNNTLENFVNRLSILENSLKHELMNRIQNEINESFKKHLLEKMSPISTPNLTKPILNHEKSIITFSPLPHRNPLLDENHYHTIYHKYSLGHQYGTEIHENIKLSVLEVPKSLFEENEDTPNLKNHFEYLRHVSQEIMTNKIYNVTSLPNGLFRILVNEDPYSLPLSYYLKVHSFLGGSQSLIMTLRSILNRTLTILHQLHKVNVILRTLYPQNILINSNTNTVLISSIFDSQIIGHKPIPLPESFCDLSNPFLPPEFFHQRPESFTLGFDIWQFGILLLYLITGHLPVSYGQQMEAACKAQHLQPDCNGIWPKPYFFYDWLSGEKIVGSNESVIGEYGECYLSEEKFATFSQIQSSKTKLNLSSSQKSTSRSETLTKIEKKIQVESERCESEKKEATVLSLQKYNLLPYHVIKGTIDESKIYLEIIAACLQIDPSKRPTTEQLLRTYPFGHVIEIRKYISEYTSNLNPFIFLSQFICPSLYSLKEHAFNLNSLDLFIHPNEEISPEMKFQFCMGTISSLLFAYEPFDENHCYSFPLDITSNDHVLKELFKQQFLDLCVQFVLRQLSDKITILDVNDIERVEDSNFNMLLEFFMKFISCIEKGQGNLTRYTNCMINSLFSLYCANPYFTASCTELLSVKESESFLFSRDSAALFVYTYHKVHAIVRYSLSCSFIQSSIQRIGEKGEYYWDEFLSFSDAIGNFANTLCHSIEKQRSNGIRIVSNMLPDFPSRDLIRLFIDFRIAQKVIHCLHIPTARLEASAFIAKALRITKFRQSDPEFILFRDIFFDPIISINCASVVRMVSPPEAIKQPFYSVIYCLMNESKEFTYSLIVNDVMWSLMDTIKEPLYKDIITKIPEIGSIFALQFCLETTSYQKALKSAQINMIPNFNLHSLDQVEENVLDLHESILFEKQLAACLFQKRSIEVMCVAVPFLMRAFGLMEKQADSIAKFLDTQLIRENRFDVKGTSFLKQKNKEKEEQYAKIQAELVEMCRISQDLFRCICLCWELKKQTSSTYQLGISINSYMSVPGTKELINYLLEKIRQPLLPSRSQPHPRTLIQQAISKMILHCLKTLSNDNHIFKQVIPIIVDLPSIFDRDISFIRKCIENNSFDSQISSIYDESKKIRKELLIHALKNNKYQNIVKYILNQMIHDQTTLNLHSLSAKNQGLDFIIRNEAIEFLLEILKYGKDHDHVFKILKEEIKEIHFIEMEKKYIRNGCNGKIEGSLKLLRGLLLHYEILGSNYDQTLNFLHSLSKRYEKDPPHAKTIALTDKRNDSANNEVLETNAKDSYGRRLKRNKSYIKPGTTISIRHKPTQPEAD